jgi:hypothetical protein
MELTTLWQVTPQSKKMKTIEQGGAYDGGQRSSLFSGITRRRAWP